MTIVKLIENYQKKKIGFIFIKNIKYSKAYLKIFINYFGYQNINLSQIRIHIYNYYNFFVQYVFTNAQGSNLKMYLRQIIVLLINSYHYTKNI